MVRCKSIKIFGNKSSDDAPNFANAHTAAKIAMILKMKN
jgi:hypothetical protein